MLTVINLMLKLLTLDKKPNVHTKKIKNIRKKYFHLVQKLMPILIFFLPFLNYSKM